MLKICLVFWETVGRGYQNEENFEICIFQIAKTTKLEQQLGQSIIYSQLIYKIEAQKYA